MPSVPIRGDDRPRSVSGHVTQLASMFGVGDFSSNFISGIAGNAGSFIIGETGTCNDLKQMLESNRDDVKLEAMKCITNMTAKGRTSLPRNLFPNIVKNVSSKNAELRKLVYLYLTNFADQEPDMALLSIASIQKSLKNPNPLVRSSALRALTSIRLNILSAIFMATIKDSVNDLNPYVKKTVAHSIIKIYRLDPNLKDSLVDHIQKLLNDKSSLVISSALAAFEVVCPERLDLLQKHYKRYCNMLGDTSEWGQVAMLNILARHARTQFADPNANRSNRNSPGEEAPITIDPDHLLLLRSAKPLLQSQNSAVVLAVIQLYLAIAPQNEIRSIIVKPIIRLLHSHREIKLVILDLVANLTSKQIAESIQDKVSGEVLEKTDTLHNNVIINGDTTVSENHINDTNNTNVDKKNVNTEEIKHDQASINDADHDEESDLAKFPYRDMFQPHIKYFFVRPTDCTLVRVIKLKILTNLCNSVNVSLVLRELQAYIMHYVEDTEFVSRCVQTIGSIASLVKEVSKQCLNGLTSLLSNRNETIVSEAIVVLRSQIIGKANNEASATTVIRQVTRLLPNIAAPQARATILWILAEFCDKNERAARSAPDVLRQIAKSFCDEKDIVKLQALNLTAKLNLFKMANSAPESDELNDSTKQTDKLSLLTNYLFSLAKYDQNYDVRDRGRFLKKLISNPDIAKQVLSQNACRMPSQVSNNVNYTFVKRCNVMMDADDEFIPGSLSYFVGHQVDGYQPLGPFAEIEHLERSAEDEDQDEEIEEEDMEEFTDEEIEEEIEVSEEETEEEDQELTLVDRVPDVVELDDDNEILNQVEERGNKVVQEESK